MAVYYISPGTAAQRDNGDPPRNYAGYGGQRLTHGHGRHQGRTASFYTDDAGWQMTVRQMRADDCLGIDAHGNGTNQLVTNPQAANRHTVAPLALWQLIGTYICRADPPRIFICACYSMTFANELKDLVRDIPIRVWGFEGLLQPGHQFGANVHGVNPFTEAE